MERNPQDQNLGDAPDDENKIFNPGNTLSEPHDKKPVGPLGTPTADEAKISKPTDPNPVGQSNKPTRDADDWQLSGRSFEESTDPSKLSDI